MRRQLYTAAAMAVGLATLSSGAVMAQDTRPGIAVMAFDNGGSYGQDAENFEALRVGIQQMLLTELAMNNAARVVERSQINALVAEQDLAADGRVDPNTAAQIGQLVGARYMIFGSFIDFYGETRIDARIVDTETSEIVNTTRVRNSREEMYQKLHGVQYDGLDRSIDLRVSRLRKKIGDDPNQPNRIKSVRGVGYLLATES